MSRRLTREDARQIVENVTGFFNTLLEWDAAVRDSASRHASEGLLAGEENRVEHDAAESPLGVQPPSKRAA